MKLIEINRRFYNVPASWNELSEKQLLQLMKLLHVSNYPLEKAFLKILKILTGMSWWEFFRAPVTTTERIVYNPFKLSLSWGVYLFRCRKICYGMDEYLYLTDFLEKENKLTKNHIADYKKFYGPADECNNLRMAEFVFSEDYFMRWSDNKDDDNLLNNLVAVLYRPIKKNYDVTKNKDGDPRIAFNQNLCEYYADTDISGWPKMVKLAIAQFYDACREKLVKDNDEIFGGATGEPAKHGLISVMIGVAESHAFGDFEKVEQLHVNMVMIQLQEQIHKAKEMERQLRV